MLKTWENPLLALQEQLGTVSTRIASLTAMFKSDVDQRMNLSVTDLRKQATLSLTPEMSGIKAPSPDENVSL